MTEIHTLEQLLLATTPHPGAGEQDVAVALQPPLMGRPRGGYVGVRINGVDLVKPPKNGERVEASCTFSNADGAPRAWLTVHTGNTKRWEGSVTGRALRPTDVIEFVYDDKASVAQQQEDTCSI